MVSLRRRPAGGGSERAPREPGREPTEDRTTMLARRIGLSAIVLTLGAGILLATLDDRSSQVAVVPTATPASPSPSELVSEPPASVGPPPGIVPVIADPSPAIVRDRSWTARVSIPTDRGPIRGLTLRVYRNNKSVREQRVKSSEMTVAGIPLKRGQNLVSAVLVGSGGEGPRSSPVTVVVDDQAPTLDLVEPADGDTVASSSITVRGRTEPGVDVTLRNASKGSSATVTADEDGAFRGTVELAPGKNELVVSTVDAVGNRGSRTITVTRADSAASIELTLSRQDFRVRELPATLDLAVEVRDLRDRPVDGAAVTFSLSPSGLPTQTYSTTTSAGIATWTGAALPREGARAGDGLATVRVTLSDGSVVQAHTTIAFR